MEGSILETIGVEIIDVISPVSICMLLVVLLVYSLTSSSLSGEPSPQPIRTAANLVYLENPTDSTAQKFEGSLLNALVFVILIAVVTFLLVCLYYYNFTNFLKNYMRFSAFFVLGTMGGSIFLSIIQHFSIPIDSITCFILLSNFTVVGVLSVFSTGIPIILRQTYMVALGIIVAAWFTNLPEWTTWFLLVALALYDLVAVLAPGGPLKLLVEMASNRDEELPALVYEARPTVSRNQGRSGSGLGLLVAGVSDSEIQEPSRSNNEIELVVREEIHERQPVIAVVDEERSPLVEMLNMGNDDDDDEEDGDSSSLTISTRGIKLGLGDFIFYSVLVGRAAMYDLMTVYACYLAIICGLGCTLILLAVYRQALPALPISITLGIMFYFLTRLLMEPFVVGTSTNLLMF
ncbi:presenilin-like protein At1g08700 [Impatiens glandulifera]|uniref:presenilin-like protein At1g08700 n=1 Tax=Impatiens glandulifera TaxID=253017 RepID=UPI001FB0A28B|nr:presenilin-like protein At1g08700 [Impatiens glandulifera]